MNDTPIVRNRDIVGILALAFAFLALGLCCAGCNGYYTQRQRESMIQRLERAQSGLSQSKIELEKLGDVADKNQLNWVGAAAQVGQWGPTDLTDTRTDINKNTGYRKTFTGQISLSDTLIGSVKSELE